MAERKRKKTELLAPAGSWESMVAAVAAGADAVYMGGTRFGARAYAQNPEDDKLREAIDYVHLHGRKLYLTVNTLLKEEELEQELYPWLAPLYETGVDAVIVQDMGVLRFLHRNFPELPIHASTQMTITGPESGTFLRDQGVVRIVTPRELNLKEIAELKAGCGLEIESFVHGALCYCYSGQCLFSSIAGGRSGNRGRCAQPCRMEYQLYRGKKMAAELGLSQEELQKAVSGKSLNRPENGFLLSLKDLNTLAMLPDIIEAGVDSLKIEGRMKRPEYTAGVVSIYRKYLDLYETKGRREYHPDPEDQQRLWDLFNRKGFTEGYYKAQNGKKMITFTKPDFRGGQETFLRELNRRYIQTEAQESAAGAVTISADTPASMTVSVGSIQKTVYSEVPVPAQKQPLTEDTLRKQLSKTGGTPFSMNHLDIYLEEGLYMPVVQLNALRREALSALEQAICKSYRRKLPQETKKIPESIEMFGREREPESSNSLMLYAQVETKDQLDAVLQAPDVSGVYLDTQIVPPQEYVSVVNSVKKAKKQCFLALPYIFRERGIHFLEKNVGWIQKAGFDGYLIRSLEELFFLKRHHLEGRLAADHNLYTWNREAAAFLREAGCTNTTLPIELTGREWRKRGIRGEELIVYGRLPMMVSAQCLKNSLIGCDRMPDLFVLKDRMGNRMPVKNNCTYCYNVIYNSRPLALMGEAKELLEQKPGAVRVIFTVETKEETAERLEVFTDAFLYGRESSISIGEFTRGHYKRETE